VGVQFFETPGNNKEKRVHRVTCTPIITQQKLEPIFMCRVKLKGEGVFTGRRAGPVRQS
jgi:hypothetical protein